MTKLRKTSDFNCVFRPVNDIFSIKNGYYSGVLRPKNTKNAFFSSIKHDIIVEIPVDEKNRFFSQKSSPDLRIFGYYFFTKSLEKHQILIVFLDQ